MKNPWGRDTAADDVMLNAVWYADGAVVTALAKIA